RRDQRSDRIPGGCLLSIEVPERVVTLLVAVILATRVFFALMLELKTANRMPHTIDRSQLRPYALLVRGRPVGRAQQEGISAMALAKSLLRRKSRQVHLTPPFELTPAGVHLV